MAKKLRLLLGLLLAAGLCFGGYFLLRGLPREESGDTGTLLWDDSEAGIQRIAFTREGQEEIAFALRDGAWSYEPDGDFPLTASYPAAMADKLTVLSAARVLTEELDPEGWGLTNPWLRITFAAGGRETTLFLGNKNSVTSQYYAMVEGRSDTVYLLDAALGSAFSYTLSTMGAVPDFLPGLAADSVFDIRVTQNGRTLWAWQDADGYWVAKYTDQEGDGQRCDQDTVDTLLDNLSYGYYSTLLSWHAEEETAVLGLSDPVRVVLKATEAGGSGEMAAFAFDMAYDSGESRWNVREEGSPYIATVSDWLIGGFAAGLTDWLAG